MKDTLKKNPVAGNPDNIDDVFAKMHDEMVNNVEIPLRHIAPYPSHDDAPTSGSVQHAPLNVGENGFDFAKIDNPQTSPDAVVELPVSGLPLHVKKIIIGVADGFQCNRDFCVVSLFAATATVLGKRVSSKFGNFLNYPSLWVVIVGNTSSGKTAPLSFFFKPIEEQEQKAFVEYLNALKQWNESGGKGEKPICRHCVLNDSTDEKVMIELSNNGSITWKNDEISTMFDCWGRYSKSGGNPIVGHLLSIFGYSNTLISRATKDDIYLVEPVLGIIGSIQPATLIRVMSGKGFTEDGLFQRFLFVWPEPSNVKPYKEILIGDDIINGWRDMLKNLSGIDHRELTETPEAKQLHIAAINRWRNEINANYKNIGAMESLLRKLEIQLCRWSIIVAALWGDDYITANHMRYSIECMEYFKRCGEKAFCLITNTDNKKKEPTNGDVIRMLFNRYPNISQTALSDVLNISQQAISKFLK